MHLKKADTVLPLQYNYPALISHGAPRLHGSYEAMEGGQSMDAMVDLTGGLAERYDFDGETPLRVIYKRMLRYSRNGSFITCSRKVRDLIIFVLQNAQRCSKFFVQWWKSNRITLKGIIQSFMIYEGRRSLILFLE